MTRILRTLIIVFFFFTQNSFSEIKKTDLIEVSWPFDGFFGRFDKASLQRGFQVYKEVCASCHSMRHLSYRNLGEKGGPEFSKEEVKAIASQFEVQDGPNQDGEMFSRVALPSDKFVKPFPNSNAARAANGGAYPPDMSVLIKARKGGANYVYSVLMGYTDEIPSNITLDEGVYYNKYMTGNKIRMPKPINDGSVEYTDGTTASEEQISKDVVAFLTWAAEPHLEARKRTGFKAIIYLLILTILGFIIKKKIWSGIETKV